MNSINDTPELDYQHEIIESGQSELLAKFYDWLIEKDFVLAKWGGYDEFGDYSEGVLMPLHIRPEQLFADFFGIDLNKIEEERRAILKELGKR